MFQIVFNIPGKSSVVCYFSVAIICQVCIVDHRNLSFNLFLGKTILEHGWCQHLMLCLPNSKDRWAIIFLTQYIVSTKSSNFKFEFHEYCQVKIPNVRICIVKSDQPGLQGGTAGESWPSERDRKRTSSLRYSELRLIQSRILNVEVKKRMHVL